MSRHFRGKNIFSNIESIGVNMGFADYKMPWGQSPNIGYAKRFFVDPTNGNDSNDGRSWRYPFKTFEKGIDAARFPHGTSALTYTDKSLRSFLFLAPGHYNEDADHANQYLWSGYSISVIGCGAATPGKDYGVSFNYDGATTTTAAFLLSGSGNEVMGIHIYCDAAIPALYIAGGDNNTIENVVIECDGTTCTYGIQADSLKGSWIKDVTICGAITAGIFADGDADRYCIDGGIRDCHISSNASNAKGIFVESTMTCHGFWIRDNCIGLTNGSSCKGIDIDATTGLYVTNNWVSVPSSATPIEHAGGEQFWMGNHTAAGTTNADPAPAAGA